MNFAMKTVEVLSSIMSYFAMFFVIYFQSGPLKVFNTPVKKMLLRTIFSQKSTAGPTPLRTLLVCLFFLEK